MQSNNINQNTGNSKNSHTDNFNDPRDPAKTHDLRSDAQNIRDESITDRLDDDDKTEHARNKAMQGPNPDAASA